MEPPRIESVMLSDKNNEFDLDMNECPIKKGFRCIPSDPAINEAAARKSRVCCVLMTTMFSYSRIFFLSHEKRRLPPCACQKCVVLSCDFADLSRINVSPCCLDLMMLFSWAISVIFKSLDWMEDATKLVWMTSCSSWQKTYENFNVDGWRVLVVPVLVSFFTLPRETI